ncbi:uncharacterized protein F4807DRAFT_21613 [Annulohypoxylon truncatum]|uniref:uncharacterized protein n=1 Tax=Annulohypoxylon truncatum TaxID=327061 RepID=UPI002007D510|nr:uncharacterized protein F4807DRAFT_21613 [Annulohypoxylon truncatum]KAI1215118.1 hypothetical protein F4807DRAFT_21613 [Annulohypoxylon truncatum]
MASTSSPQTPPQPTSPPQSQPQQQQLQQPQVDQYNNTNPYVHNVALGVTPVALFALFLPPRRLDLRFLVLGGVALWGTNQLVHDYTGTSTLHRFARRAAVFSGTELPEKAKETQLRLRLERAERARKLRELEGGAPHAVRDVGGLPAEQRRLVEEQQRQRQQQQQGRKEDEEGEEGSERGMLKRLWMGDSPDDWKEKRIQREKEALSEGGVGYWGLIVEQISEVWNGGKKKDDGDKTTDKEKGSAEGESKKS